MHCVLINNKVLHVNSDYTGEPTVPWRMGKMIARGYQDGY